APADTAAGAATIAESEPPEWLDVFADYPRYLHHQRRLAIAATNNGGTAIEVTGIGLRAEHFTSLGSEPKSATIAPGSRTDLQVDFGAVFDCAVTAPLTAVVDIELLIPPQPVPQRFTIPIDPGPLDEMRDTECRKLAVTDAVGIGFAPQSTVTGMVLATGIVLDRNLGDEPVTVESLRGTEIVTLRSVPRDIEPVAVLDPGVPALPIPVELEVIRCDPHAVGQVTKPYEFKLWVAVGDADPQLMVLNPDDELKTALQELIAQCIDRGGP
ncbi:MAG: hypothetical protein M3349_01580, partial [Actinomycetota bacterium]|nr:hypothetical protein [Actinomycetota bacterium]